MKFSKNQIEKMVQRVFDSWDEQKITTYKASEKDAFKRAVELIQAEFDKEREIERQANEMVEQLESANPGMERHKLFVGVKNRLAKEKGVIL